MKILKIIFILLITNCINNINILIIKDKGVDEDLKLITACQTGDIEKAKTLIENGANVNYKNYYTYKALTHASLNGYEEIVNLLIKAGANIDNEERNGWTALMFASKYGHEKVVETLLENGANINSKEKNSLFNFSYRNTAYQVDSDGEIVDEEDEEIDNRDVGTALMIAAEHGSEKVVKLLLEKGINVNDKNDNGWTALMFASEKGHDKVVKMLLEHGADINSKNNNNETALILAFEEKKIEIIKILINNKAEISYKNSYNIGTITYLVENIKNRKKVGNYIEIAYLLIKQMRNKYIDLFISINKNDNTITNELKDHINLLNSLLKLPRDLFIEVIKNL